MRIIAGTLGGRQFESPHGHRTHPMGDKIRGALFNILGEIDGLTVLDAFAGSGALSFEAISRGAGSSVAIDLDKGANTTIVKNLRELGLNDRVKSIQANAMAWSRRHQTEQFDIVLCDPPYDKLHVASLQLLSRHVRPGGVFVVSWPSKLPVPELAGLTHLSDKQYGSAQLIFYKRVL